MLQTFSYRPHKERPPASPIVWWSRICGVLLVALVLAWSSSCSRSVELRTQEAIALQARSDADRLGQRVAMLEDEAAGLRTLITERDVEISALEEEIESLTEQMRELAKKASSITTPAAPAPRVTEQPSRASDGTWRRAKASWYGPGLYGNKTADGTHYTPETWCVAHKTLPLGTMVEIRYSGKTVQVPVKDRGPFTPGRELDLSNAVRLALGFEGVQTVEWRVVGGGE